MYQKRSGGWSKHADFIFLDFICIQLAFVLGFWVRHGLGSPYAMPIYRQTAISVVFIHIIVVFFGECYKGILRRGYYQEFVAVLKQVFATMLVLTGFLFINDSDVFSRTTLLMMSVFYVLLDYGVRLIWKNLLRQRGKGGSRAMFFVSTEGQAQVLLQTITENNYEGIRAVGVAILDRNMEGQSIAGIPVVAGKHNLLSYVSTEWVDEVFVHVSKQWDDTEELNQLIDKFATMGVTVHKSLEEVKKLHHRQQFVERVAGYEVLTTTIKVVTSQQLFFKRLLDICGGFVGCLLTLFFTLFIGPAIFVKSPGPIFFSQIRVGKNGKRFKIYKFRSMYLDAEERKKELEKHNQVEDGMMFKIKDDPRIIKGVGHFIRKFSLDEFPQFFNVLKGDMSLVGTRPPTVDEWEKYDLHHRKRLAIKPGLTGLWQVSGRSNIKDFEEVVALDTQYINEWNFGQDIKILLKTVKVVLFNEGAV